MEYAVLTDLPIPVRIEGDISAQYVRELKSVYTEDELEKFTQRWKALWRLPSSHADDSVMEIEESITTNTYDRAEALECIKQCRTHPCKHAEESIMCVGMNILLPNVLTQCFILARMYAAPFNVALVQLQKAFDNLPDHVAEEIFGGSDA